MGKEELAKFTGQGFHTWQSKVKGYLMRKNLWAIAKPLGERETTESRANLTRFQERDEQAFGVLLTALDDNYIHYLDSCTTALEAWTTLERHFGAKAKDLNSFKNAVVWLNNGNE